MVVDWSGITVEHRLRDGPQGGPVGRRVRALGLPVPLARTQILVRDRLKIYCGTLPDLCGRRFAEPQAHEIPDRLDCGHGKAAGRRRRGGGSNPPEAAGADGGRVGRSPAARRWRAKRVPKGQLSLGARWAKLSAIHESAELHDLDALDAV